MIELLCLYLFTTIVIAFIISQFVATDIYFSYIPDMPLVWFILCITVFIILCIASGPLFVPIYMVYKLIKDFQPFIESVKRALKKLNND